jgi:hypothetical protein
MRDTTARISAESLVTLCTCEARVMRDIDGLVSRFHAVTSERSSEIAHEGGA